MIFHDYLFSRINALGPNEKAERLTGPFSDEQAMWTAAAKATGLKNENQKLFVRVTNSGAWTEARIDQKLKALQK
jgi:hypothetical protein